MSSLSVIVSLIFLAATLIIYLIYWVLVINRREQQIINRRLLLNRNLGSSSVVLQALLQERGFSNVSNPVLRQLSDWLTQTGIRVQRRTLGLVFLVVWILFMLVFSELLGAGLLSLFLALVVPSCMMIGFLSFQRRRRIFDFSEQFPDAIDIVRRGVRVGLPFSSAIGLVAREMYDPVGTEFGILADEIAFGLDLRSALQNLFRRVGQEDLLFFTVAVTIQSQTGGNLGEILSRLSKLMRSRGKMRLKVKALSAEGRFSAVFLTVFPFVLMAIVTLISPSYYGAIRGHPLVEPAIFLGVGLLLVGNIIMYRIVHFKY